MALYYRLPQTYTMLGVTYLFVGLVRAISMFVDKSVVNPIGSALPWRSFWGSFWSYRDKHEKQPQ